VDFVIILRDLWRRRLLVVAVAVVALLIGGMTTYRLGMPPQSRQYEVGIASARALVDTPSSQVVDLGMREDTNVGVLPARAVLLANLMTTTPLKDQIAERAGVPKDQLIANADTPTDGVPVTAPLATGTSLSPGDPQAKVITLKTDVSLPLLTVNSQAPDAETAAKLADSTLAVLDRYLDSLGTDERVPESRRLIIKPLGSARSATEQRGPSKVFALAVAIVVFGLGCVLIVVAVSLARAWQNAAAIEELRENWDAPDDPDLQPVPADDDEPEPRGARGSDRFVA